MAVKVLDGVIAMRNNLSNLIKEGTPSAIKGSQRVMLSNNIAALKPRVLRFQNVAQGQRFRRARVMVLQLVVLISA